MTNATLTEIVDLAGIAAAVRLCKAYGGRLVYVPRQLNETHPLALSLGTRAAHELSRRFGGERIAIPPESAALVEMRNSLIVNDYQGGLSISRLSRSYGISRKWVAAIIDKANINRRSLADAAASNGRGLETGVSINLGERESTDGKKPGASKNSRPRAGRDVRT